MYECMQVLYGDAIADSESLRAALLAGDVWINGDTVELDVTTGRSDWHLVRGPALAYLEEHGIPVRMV